jgi:hypothetical protein
VVLDTRTRASIYQKLIPVLGEDDANALISEFPASEADELVTTSVLRAEMAGLRGEFADLRGEFAVLRGEFADLRGDVANLETRLTVRMGALGAVLSTLMVGLKVFG